METLETLPEEAPPRGRGRTCLIVLLAAAVICMLLCGGGMVVGYFFLAGLKQMGPYQTALEKVSQDPEVIGRLGKPIEDATWIPNMQVNIENDQGSSSMDFQVAGPEGKADVRCQARMTGGIWAITDLSVRFTDGERIVLSTTDEGLEDAPKWTPPAGPEKAPGDPVAPPTIDLNVPNGVPGPPGEITLPVPG